jgi:hypothetical protein
VAIVPGAGGSLRWRSGDIWPSRAARYASEASKSDFVQDQSTCMKELQEPPRSAGISDMHERARLEGTTMTGNFLLRFI